MESRLYHATRARRFVRPSAFRNPHAGPALTRADLFRPAPGAPVLSPHERAALMRRFGIRTPGLSGLGWGFHFSLPHISLPSLPHISIPTPAALAHKLGLPAPSDIAHALHIPTPADILAKLHIDTSGLPASMIPGTQARRDQAAYNAAVQEAQRAAAQQAAIQQAAEQAAANQAAADQMIVQQAQAQNLAPPAAAPLPMPASPMYAPQPDYSSYAPASADTYGVAQSGDLTAVNLPAPAMPDYGYQPDMSAYQPMPSPAATVPAYAPDVNAPSAYTVDDTGSTTPDFSSGYDYSGGYDSSGLQGMGADPAASDAGGWGGTLQNILQAATGVWQQKKLTDINLQRAQQGLPPISATDAGVGVQASVGLDRPTRNMILMGVGGLAIVGGLLYMSRKSRR